MIVIIMQLVRTFGDHHQRKDFTCFRWNPRSCGYKYRLLCTGEIIERYKGKHAGWVDNQDQLELLMNLRGRKLDILLLNLIK